MPNERQPSDHAPVSARFAFRSPHSQLEADARQWLHAMHGETIVRPLSRAELRRAFSFFDKDGSGVISEIELEAGIELLQYPNLSAQRVRASASSKLVIHSHLHGTLAGPGRLRAALSARRGSKWEEMH